MRKHSSQMTQREIGFLTLQVSNVHSWSFTRHAREKMEERNVFTWEVQEALKLFSIIEANFEGGEKILIRGKRDIHGLQVCAVIAPKKERIITVYFNSADDVHKTIRLEAYDSDIDVVNRWNE